MKSGREKNTVRQSQALFPHHDCIIIERPIYAEYCRVIDLLVICINPALTFKKQHASKSAL